MLLNNSNTRNATTAPTTTALQLIQPNRRIASPPSGEPVSSSSVGSDLPESRLTNSLRPAPAEALTVQTTASIKKVIVSTSNRTT
jgi:hypothetical protein